VITPSQSALRRAISYTTADTWIGVLMLIAAVVYWLEANSIRISPLDGPVGASGLPKMLAYVLAGLSLLLIIRGVTDAKSRLTLPAAKLSQARSLTQWIKPHLRALGMLAIGVGYLSLLPWFGYSISIAALLLAVSLYNGASFNLRTLLVASIGAALCNTLFVQFLGIALPAGELPEMVLGHLWRD